MTDEERAKRVEEIRKVNTEEEWDLPADEAIGFLLSELDRVTAERDAALTQVKTLRGALREIALAGTTRPMVMGEGDDGDGWFRRIALELIGTAARALATAPKEDPEALARMKAEGEEIAREIARRVAPMRRGPWKGER